MSFADWANENPMQYLLVVPAFLLGVGALLVAIGLGIRDFVLWRYEVQDQRALEAQIEREAQLHEVATGAIQTATNLSFRNQIARAPKPRTVRARTMASINDTILKEIDS